MKTTYQSLRRVDPSSIKCLLSPTRSRSLLFAIGVRPPRSFPTSTIPFPPPRSLAHKFNQICSCRFESANTRIRDVRSCWSCDGRERVIELLELGQRMTMVVVAVWRTSKWMSKCQRRVECGEGDRGVYILPWHHSLKR